MAQGSGTSRGPDLEDRAQEIYAFLAERCDALSAVLEQHMDNLRLELDAERICSKGRCKELRADVDELGVKFAEILEQRDWIVPQRAMSHACPADFSCTSAQVGSSPQPEVVTVSPPPSPQTLHRPTRQSSTDPASVHESAEKTSPPVRPPVASLSLPSSPQTLHRPARQRSAIWSSSGPPSVPTAVLLPPSPRAAPRPAAQITSVRLNTALAPAPSPPLAASCPSQSVLEARGRQQGPARAQMAPLRGTPAATAEAGRALGRSASTPWTPRAASAAAASMITRCGSRPGLQEASSSASGLDLADSVRAV